jgi:hypothetical protein
MALLLATALIVSGTLELIHWLALSNPRSGFH